MIMVGNMVLRKERIWVMGCAFEWHPGWQVFGIRPRHMTQDSLNAGVKICSRVIILLGSQEGTYGELFCMR